MKEDSIKTIIEYATQHELSERYKGVFGRWLLSNKDRKVKDAALMDVWNATSEVSDGKEGEGLQRLLAEIAPHEEKMLVGRNVKRWVGVAAMVLLVFGAGYMSSMLWTSQVEVSHLITSDNTKGRFELPDGSVVWLSESSQLTYSSDFGDSRREVALTGGGYFEVAHDKERPFEVTLSDMKVEVLGTTFDVSNYAHLITEEVVLIEGRVAISTDEIDEYVLRPNQKFAFNRLSGKARVTSVNGENYATWMNKQLVFEDTQLEDVLDQLGRWYHLDVEIANGVDVDCKMNFKLQSETAEEALKVLGRLCDVRYDITDKTILISKN